MSLELERAAAGARVAVASLAASGRPVIGIVGRDVPAVLVAASGAHPFRIAPDEEPTDEADRILGRAIDRAASRVLASVLTGSLDFVRGILIARDSDASVRLFYTLQELHRRGRVAVPVQLVDQVHQYRESTVRYNVSQLDRLWRTVETWTATTITTESVAAAQAGGDEMRTELTAMRQRRRSGQISGLTALHGYRVASALPTAETVALLRVTSSEPAAIPFPLFLTGSAPLGDEVYRAVEDAGATIVGEDHDWGDPILSDRLPDELPSTREELLHEFALARLRGAPASASATMAARAEATHEGIIASGARGLLSVVRTHDEAPAWDWRRQSERAGVPGMLIRGEGADSVEELANAVETLRTAS